MLKTVKNCLEEWPAKSIGLVLQPFYGRFFCMYPSYADNVTASILTFLHCEKHNKVFFFSRRNLLSNWVLINCFYFYLFIFFFFIGHS